jgi:hypothetical protein
VRVAIAGTTFNRPGDDARASGPMGREPLRRGGRQITAIAANGGAGRADSRDAG